MTLAFEKKTQFFENFMTVKLVKTASAKISKNNGFALSLEAIQIAVNRCIIYSHQRDLLAPNHQEQVGLFGKSIPIFFDKTNTGQYFL